MAVTGSHFDYANQAWTLDGVYIRCGHPESMNCGCYGKAHAGQPAPIENLPTATPSALPTIEQWHAIVDAMTARGLKATLEGGGAACPFIGIELADGRMVAFGDMAETWGGQIYPNLTAWEQGGDSEPLETTVPNTVFDAERIADETVKAITESDARCE